MSGDIKLDAWGMHHWWIDSNEQTPPKTDEIGVVVLCMEEDGTTRMEVTTGEGYYDQDFFRNVYGWLPLPSCVWLVARKWLAQLQKKEGGTVNEEVGISSEDS